jgi:coenzyme F420-reducing hydrogenase gamma subunit
MAMKYLGVELYKPKVAFFDFTGCEGCQLTVFNKENTLVDFLSLVEVVNFREAISDRGENYEIAFIEGAITREDEIARLKKIRLKAKVLVAMGSCACFGGVNQLRNKYENNLAWVKNEVYGEHPIETNKSVAAAEDIVPVDLRIYGCPPSKAEIEKIVQAIVLKKKYKYPKYPVCMECKANENICLYDIGKMCLGPITRAGCGATCANARRGCFGCRGLADEPTVEQMNAIMQREGFSKEQIFEKMSIFGGFKGLKEDS